MVSRQWKEIADFFGRKIRFIISVGLKTPSIPFENEELVTYGSPVSFLRHNSLLRADLIFLLELSRKVDIHGLIKKIYQSSHDQGCVYLCFKDEKILTLLLRSGFKKTKIKNLFIKNALPTPKEYGQSYLERWGNTDFLKNWKMAGEQILVHMPPGFAKSTVRVLDVGCLNGYIMETLRMHGVKNIFGTDISYEIAIKHCIDRYHLPAITIGDFCENNYPDAFSDMTIAMEILEHIFPERTDRFIQQLGRVTADRGVILISTSEDWNVDPTHINCRKRREWYRLFMKHGLFPKGKQEIFGGFNSFVLRKASNQFERQMWYMFYTFLDKANLLK